MNIILKIHKSFYTVIGLKLVTEGEDYHLIKIIAPGLLLPEDIDETNWVFGDKVYKTEKEAYDRLFKLMNDSIEKTVIITTDDI